MLMTKSPASSQPKQCSLPKEGAMHKQATLADIAAAMERAATTHPQAVAFLREADTETGGSGRSPHSGSYTVGQCIDWLLQCAEPSSRLAKWSFPYAGKHRVEEWLHGQASEYAQWGYVPKEAFLVAALGLGYKLDPKTGCFLMQRKEVLVRPMPLEEDAPRMDTLTADAAGLLFARQYVNDLRYSTRQKCWIELPARRPDALFAGKLACEFIIADPERARIKPARLLARAKHWLIEAPANPNYGGEGFIEESPLRRVG
jgi:hypothetical protein